MFLDWAHIVLPESESESFECMREATAFGSGMLKLKDCGHLCS